MIQPHEASKKLIDEVSDAILKAESDGPLPTGDKIVYLLLCHIAWQDVTIANREQTIDVLYARIKELEGANNGL